jgi:hypothetical protein
LPLENEPHPASGAHGEVNSEAIEKVNVSVIIPEISVQKTFEPCSVQSPNLQPIRQLLICFGSQGLCKERSCNERPNQNYSAGNQTRVYHSAVTDSERVYTILPIRLPSLRRTAMPGLSRGVPLTTAPCFQTNQPLVISRWLHVGAEEDRFVGSFVFLNRMIGGKEDEPSNTT